MLLGRLQRNWTPTKAYFVRFLKNYYQILNVDPKCSRREIKKAFVKLSKQVHPDKSSCSKSHEKFVILNEAYSVLSKPAFREDYDRNLRNFKARTHQDFTDNVPTERKHNFWHDNSIWEFRDKSEDKKYEGKSYYGIKGVKRLSNTWIATGCIIFIAFGAIAHYISFNLGRHHLDELDKISKENSHVLQEVLKKAKELGKEEQIKRLHESLKHDTKSQQTEDTGRKDS